MVAAGTAGLAPGQTSRTARGLATAAPANRRALATEVVEGIMKTNELG